MKIEMKYLNFLSYKKTGKSMRENFFKNISERKKIFNEHLNIDKAEEIFEINFSTYFKKRRTDVYIKIVGVINMRILIKTPFSYGTSFSLKRKLKEILVNSLGQTLRYY